MDPQSHFVIFITGERLREAEIERRRAIRERDEELAGGHDLGNRVRRARRQRRVRQLVPPRFA